MKTDKIATAAAAKRAEQKAKTTKVVKPALETTEAKPAAETKVEDTGLAERRAAMKKSKQSDAQKRKAAKAAKKTPAPAKKAPAKKTAAKKVAAKKEAKPVEHADHLTKGGTILELLQRKGGATSAELMQATGWQRHSVRGYISAVVGKKLGLKVTTGRNEAGEHTYQAAK